MSDETTLLPCPFCGGEAEIIEAVYGMYLTGYAIYCRKCCLKLGVTGRLGEAYEWSPVFNTEAEAIAAWNARAERTCRNVHKEWEKTSFAGAETSFCCSECGAHYFDAESYYAGLADADGDLIRTNFCPNCGAKVVDDD